jgi:hypothetical protein
MEIIAITGILATAAVIVLAIRQPWRAPGVRLAVLWLFVGRPARHGRRPADPRTPQQIWDDGPVPPVGSMVRDAELEYRAMAGLLPPDPPPTTADRLRRAGAELNARADAQRAAWAEERPGLLLLPGGGPERGPERPPEPPWPDAQPPGPAERTDGGTVPPGAWRGQFDALAPPDPPYPLPWPRAEGDWLPRPLPPWAVDGGDWQIPPGAFLEPLPPGGDRLPEDDGPEVQPHDDGTSYCTSLPACPLHPEPEAGESWGPLAAQYLALPRLGGAIRLAPLDDEPEPQPGEGAEWPGAMHWAPSRMADPGELFRAELASEVLADIRARDADVAGYLDRQAADLATTASVMTRGITCQTNT